MDQLRHIKMRDYKDRRLEVRGSGYPCVRASRRNLTTFSEVDWRKHTISQVQVQWATDRWPSIVRKYCNPLRGSYCNTVPGNVIQVPHTPQLRTRPQVTKSTKPSWYGHGRVNWRLNLAACITGRVQNMTETCLGAALAGDLGVQFGQEFGATSDQPGTAPADSRDFILDFMKQFFESVSVLQGLESTRQEERW
jgi:hypothetical protein